MIINCQQCGKSLCTEGGPEPVASISGGIMGDEYTDSYFFCPDCNVYTVEVYCDRFLGEEESSFRGPIPREVGDKYVRLIAECPDPWDKKCRCAAHRSYFNASLD